MIFDFQSLAPAARRTSAESVTKRKLAEYLAKLSETMSESTKARAFAVNEEVDEKRLCERRPSQRLSLRNAHIFPEKLFNSKLKTIFVNIRIERTRAGASDE